MGNRGATPIVVVTQRKDAVEPVVPTSDPGDTSRLLVNRSNPTRGRAPHHHRTVGLLAVLKNGDEGAADGSCGPVEGVGDRGFAVRHSITDAQPTNLIVGGVGHDVRFAVGVLTRGTSPRCRTSSQPNHTEITAAHVDGPVRDAEER